MIVNQGIGAYSVLYGLQVQQGVIYYSWQHGSLPIFNALTNFSFQIEEIVG